MRHTVCNRTVAVAGQGALEDVGKALYIDTEKKAALLARKPQEDSRRGYATPDDV